MKDASGIAAAAALLALLAFAFRHALRHFRGEGGCCGGGAADLRPARKTLGGPVVAVKRLRIEGMTCPHCSARVEQALNDVEGALARVDLDRGVATVQLDRAVPARALLDAVAKAGYKAAEAPGAEKAT